MKIFQRKNLGDASASPVCCLLILLLVLLFLLCLFLGCHGSILPFHFSWTCYSNGRLLQLIECIESLKSDVKKKMMLARACDRCTKVTCERLAKKFSRLQASRSKFSRQKLVTAFTISNFDDGEKMLIDDVPAHDRMVRRSSREFQSLSPPRASIIGVEKSSREHINGCLRRGCHHFRLSHAGGKISGKPVRS